MLEKPLYWLFRAVYLVSACKIYFSISEKSFSSLNADGNQISDWNIGKEKQSLFYVNIWEILYSNDKINN